MQGVLIALDFSWFWAFAIPYGGLIQKRQIFQCLNIMSKVFVIIATKSNFNDNHVFNWLVAMVTK